MVRTLFAIILLTSVNFANAQEHYYWAYGKKYPLELYSGKQYVLVQGQNRVSIAQGLGVSEQNISDLSPITVSKTIRNNLFNRSRNDNLHWGFVSRAVDKEKIQSSNILYAAPSFLVNGKEIGLSHYFYVKLTLEKDFELLESLAKQNKVEIVGNDSFMPLWYILSCDKNSKGNALEMANLFYETGYFSSAQPDLMEDLIVNCTNDGLFNQQWHLNNTGQSGGTVGNDINICPAWNITMGCADIVVAVLDMGLEFNHPDFANISPISFDTETGTSPSIIRGNHGVAVAGVIGATANNTIGVAGVAPGVQLMSISNTLVLGPLFSQRISNGINFAWQNGAAIINNSWSHNSITQQGLINDAINNAVTQGRGGLGTILIFSSGNDDRSPINYPANNSNVISVGAINRTPSRATFSNYGTGLDVVAPGVSISTTDRQGALGYNQTVGANGNYTSIDGTSFSAPQVAGIAALILSLNPALTLQQVRGIIEGSTDKPGNYTYTLGTGEQPALTWNNKMGYGRVNAFKALQAALPIAGPSVVCANETYTLQNQPVGTTVAWNSSNPSGLSINSTTGAANRLNNFNGRVTITASINRGCGTVNVTREVGVGTYLPLGVSSYNSNCSGGTFNILNTSLSAACTANTSIYFNYNITDSNYSNFVFTPVSVPSGATWSFNGGSLNMTVTTPSSQGSRSATIALSTSNPCGTFNANFTSTAVNYYSSFFSISPNPSKQNVTVSTESENSLDDSSQNLIYAIKITDLFETFGKSFEYEAGIKSTNIPLQDFKSGLYILSVFDGKMWSSKQLLIQK